MSPASTMVEYDRQKDGSTIALNRFDRLQEIFSADRHRKISVIRFCGGTERAKRKILHREVLSDIENFVDIAGCSGTYGVVDTGSRDVLSLAADASGLTSRDIEFLEYGYGCLPLRGGVRIFARLTLPELAREIFSKYALQHRFCGATEAVPWGFFHETLMASHTEKDATELCRMVEAVAFVRRSLKTAAHHLPSRAADGNCSRGRAITTDGDAERRGREAK